MILLTGATGKTGAAVARALAGSGRNVRALVRNEAKAAPLRDLGVDVAVGDMADPAAVTKALAGVDRALLLLPNGQQQLHLETQFVDLAKAAGTRHVLKISSMEALPDARSPIPQAHFASEQHIRASGLAWTMIRPNFYMQNMFGGAASIKSQGKFFLPMGKGKVAMTDTRDVAAFIAHVLSSDGHEGQSYEVTGPEILSFSDAADRYTEVLGKRVEYVDIDPGEYRKVLAPFTSSEWHLDAVMKLFAEIAAGEQPLYVTDTFRRMMGREPTSFAQFIRDHRAVFGG